MSTSWLVLFDFIVLYFGYKYFLNTRWKSYDKSMQRNLTIFYGYICIVIYLTLMPILTSLPSVLNSSIFSMHLLPFDDVLNHNGDAIFQVIINIIMFIPFGYLLPQVKKLNFFQVVLLAFLFTLSIELLQPILNSWRISDVTDVITNTIGGIVGYIIYKIVKKLKSNNS